MFSISSSTLLKRLRSGSRKNATYAAFREVGRVIRTVQLLRCLSDAPLRRRVTAATNKVEPFNRFSQWIGFGNLGVIAHEPGIQPEAYDPELDVDFTPLREQDLTAAGLGQAA
ncbi:Tn3 family transposase [Streptomyces sp. bgisy130]|uniref:Tn3 family transposase n=1 Tax=Streptomyces sp. bgisy130 TaxID=3413788 RepID=UPI003F49DD81